MVELSIGVGLAVAGWALSSALTGSWDTNALQDEVADAMFFTGMFMFISAGVNALKYLYRSDPYPAPELVYPSKELTDAELKSFGERGINQGFRQVTGTHDDAMRFVRSQTLYLNEVKPNVFLGKISRGIIFVTYDQPITRWGAYTSIRIYGVNGLKGIKFMWP